MTPTGAPLEAARLIRITSEAQQLHGFGVAQAGHLPIAVALHEEAVVDALNKIVKSKIELDKKIDPDLIGGMVVQVDDLLIDGSVKSSLQDLKQQ